MKCIKARALKGIKNKRLIRKVIKIPTNGIKPIMNEAALAQRSISKIKPSRGQ
jgi:hypothetical protein